MKPMSEIEKLEHELMAINHIIESGFSNDETQALKEKIESLLIQEQEKVVYGGQSNGSI